MRIYKTIELPYLYDLDFQDRLNSPLAITSQSPNSLKKAVEQMGTYLKRELPIDHIPYTAEIDGKNTAVESWLWTDHDWEGLFAVGGCAFRRTELEWVWVLETVPDWVRVELDTKSRQNRNYTEITFEIVKACFIVIRGIENENCL